MSNLSNPIPLQDVQNLIDESGVYEITCKKNGRVYIGQSSSILSRVKQHVSQLSSGTHSNNLLQYDWNKYSGDQFLFRLILHVPAENRDELFRQESKEIQRYRNLNMALYNQVTAYVVERKTEYKDIVPTTGTMSQDRGKQHHAQHNTQKNDSNSGEIYNCYDCGKSAQLGIDLFHCVEDKQYRCEKCMDSFLVSSTMWIATRNLEHKPNGKLRFRWVCSSGNLRHEIIQASSIYAIRHNCKPQTILIPLDAEIPEEIEDITIIRDEITPSWYIDILIPV